MCSELYGTRRSDGMFELCITVSVTKTMRMAKKQKMKQKNVVATTSSSGLDFENLKIFNFKFTNMKRFNYKFIRFLFNLSVQCLFVCWFLVVFL